MSVRTSVAVQRDEFRFFQFLRKAFRLRGVFEIGKERRRDFPGRFKGQTCIPAAVFQFRGTSSIRPFRISVSQGPAPSSAARGVSGSRRSA